MEKPMFVPCLVLVLFVLSPSSFADVFNLGPGLTSLETVIVGDQGNAGELSGSNAGGYGYDRICGVVGYEYYVGKYEITAAQYADFLNKVAITDTYGLYNYHMADPTPGAWGCNIQRSGSSGSYTYSVALDWANRPVNYVSFWDACRFANWLHNGQPTGLQNASTTEGGAYSIDGYSGKDGRNIRRNAGWKWAVTSEDEWYKAAYYRGGGTNAGYWDFPTQNDMPSAPGNQIISPDDGNNANYINLQPTIGSPYYRTNVGEFENSKSAFGTLDQGGNIHEWNESIVSVSSNYAFRSQRGGSYGDYGYSELRSSYRGYDSDPSYDSAISGFRIVAIPSVVPEPSSLLILGTGLLALAGKIRRRR